MKIDMRLFAYGTLMLPAVMETVIGRRVDGAAAVLAGYARYRVLGEDFPGLVPSDNSMTDGVLYDGVEKREIELLDRYEGGWYERTSVKVSRAGVRADAFVYVTRPEYFGILTAEPWELEKYARQSHRILRGEASRRLMAVREKDK